MFSKAVLSFCSLSVLFLSFDAVALATREPNNNMTRQMCQSRINNQQVGFGNDIVLIEGSEMCVYDRRGSTQRLVINANSVISYPRDTMQLYYPLAKGQQAVNLWISGTGRSEAPYYGGTAPWQLGSEVEVLLDELTTINGQTIYRISDSDAIGIRLWTAVNGGGNISGNASYQINNKHQVSGAGLGDQWGGIRNYATNHFFQVAYEIVVLNVDAVGQTISVPARQIGTMKLHSANYPKISGRIDYPIMIEPMNFTFVPRTCSYQEAREIAVKLDKIGIGHFTNRNEVYGGATTLNLHCQANSNVTPWVTFTDNSDINNNTNVLGLTSDSTAQNLGLRIYMNDNSDPVKFGPVQFKAGTEQSSVGRAIQKQDYMRQVGTASDTARNHQIKLVAKYFKKSNQAPIVPGKVKGEMMFTFAYY